VAADWSALIMSAGSFVKPSCFISCRLLTSGPLVCPPCLLIFYPHTAS
jgi:hypothetical protein